MLIVKSTQITPTLALVLFIIEFANKMLELGCVLLLTMKPYRNSFAVKGIINFGIIYVMLGINLKWPSHAWGCLHYSIKDIKVFRLQHSLLWRMGGSRWLVGYIPTWTTCSRHNTSRLTEPNILLVKVVSVGGTLWLPVPCMRKLHTRPALTWIAVSIFIRSGQ